MGFEWIQGSKRAKDLDLGSNWEGFSKLIKDVASQASPPDFEEVWAKVEVRARNLKAQEEGSRGRSIWQASILVPAVALLAAAILLVLWAIRPHAPTNMCVVESYEVEYGTVLVEQDLDDPERPTVIWYQEDG